MITMNRTIYITQSDMNRLRSLIESMKSSREDLKTLRAELDQAHVVSPSAIPPDVITMNSKAQLRLHARFSSKSECGRRPDFSARASRNGHAGPPGG